MAGEELRDLKSTLEALGTNIAYKAIYSRLVGLFEAKSNQIMMEVATSVESAFQDNFLKGEARGLVLAMKAPADLLEEVTDQINRNVVIETEEVEDYAT